MLIEWNIEIYITPLNEREKERKRERVFLHDCEGGLRLPTNFPVVTADSATSGFLSVFQRGTVQSVILEGSSALPQPMITSNYLFFAPSIHPSSSISLSLSLSLLLSPLSYYPNWLLWSKEEVCWEQGRLLWTPHQRHSTPLHFEIIGSPCFWSLCKRTLLFTRWLCT